MEDTKLKTAAKKDLKSVATKLNGLLSSYQVFYQNLRGVHWNIEGDQFFELHVKFEEFYKEAAEAIDDIAERILALNEMPLHTYEDFLEKSQIKSAKKISDPERAISTLADNLKTLIRQENEVVLLAQNAKDLGTEDMLTGFIVAQEKILWMLRAFLK